MPSQHVLELCSSEETITSEVAKHPNKPIHKVIRSLKSKWRKRHIRNAINPRKEGFSLDEVVACGKFATRPSDLFLKIYGDVLRTLERDPLAGLVSPSLMAATGTIPLSIVSVIPDIMRHYAELIVHAQTEVFLATNYWEMSHSSDIIKRSLVELSRRAEDRADKVVVKIMYDRGFIGQLLNSRSMVEPSQWAKVGLPKQEEIPNILLEVINYHRLPLGTFHAKFLIVDRAVACLNSNNIQDRPNVEMMVHLEGPIVDSFYDVALASWSHRMNPPLPLISARKEKTNEYHFKKHNKHLAYIDTALAGKFSRALINKQLSLPDVEEKAVRRATQRISEQIAESMRASFSEHGTDDSGFIETHPNMVVPTMEDEVAEQTRRILDEQDNNNAAVMSPQDVSPPQSSHGLLDVAKENSSKSSMTRLQAISEHLNSGNLLVDPTVKEHDLKEDFKPHILHSKHDPVPMALVNRPPRGRPGHHGVRHAPQNAAWLSGLKHAQKTVFIQTPTFNASPVISATLDACRRGVVVTLYLDLGFNDLGEMIPFQGGTNEHVVHKMYKNLNAERKEKNLRVYWYTAKDQCRPIGAMLKKRNCHVKFMSVDDQVCILGNGNQDTQSWYHSQEINVMVDSNQHAKDWLCGMNANQNTRDYGLVNDTDGIWRDKDGVKVQSSGVKSYGVIDWTRSITGAIIRISKKGGF